MREVLGEFRDWRKAREDVAVATVAETWGSSPRPLGSRMLVSASGKMAGSVSNGCIEGAVFEEAQAILKLPAEERKPKLAAFGVADDLAFEVGLACGGHIEVFIQPANEVHDSLRECIEEERPAILHTNVADGETFLLLREPETETPYRDGDWLIEPYPRPPHLVIVGAIHIAIPLHRLAKFMGYHVTVIDARAQFATAERFPEADELVVAWPDEALKAVTIDRSTFLVILTHDPKFDMPALRAVVGKGAGYVGAIGSRRTNQNRFDALRAEGFTEEQLEQVRGPIGLDLGARGAEETALGILAEITATRFGGTAAPMKEKAPQP